MENTIIQQKKAELKRSKRKQGMVAFALISPYLIIFILFTLIPVILGFGYSFMKYNPHNPAQNGFIGFDNYLNIFNFDLAVSKRFWSSFTTMLVFDLVAVPIMTIIPLILAYLLNMHPPGYKVFRAIIYLPSVVSISIMGIIFGNIFKGDEYGLLNALLGTKIDWLGGMPWQGDTLRWVVILIASIWWQTGTNFVIFSGALRNVPKSLFEACEVDGGKRLHKIFYVILPNIKTSVAVCVFNTLIGYLGLYGQPFVLNTVENMNEFVSPMMFIQHYLMDGTAYAGQTGYLCACAIVFGLITMIFSIIQRKAMAERKRKSVFTVSCNKFLKEKKMLNAKISVLDTNQGRTVEYE